MTFYIAVFFQGFTNSERITLFQENDWHNELSLGFFKTNLDWQNQSTTSRHLKFRELHRSFLVKSICNLNWVIFSSKQNMEIFLPTHTLNVEDFNRLKIIRMFIILTIYQHVYLFFKRIFSKQFFPIVTQAK